MEQTIVWIAKDHHLVEPEQCIATGKTHYFYWEKQIFPPHFPEFDEFSDYLQKTIERRGLSTNTQKTQLKGDYEPLYYFKGRYCILISRFHYHFAIIWTSPCIRNKKPVIGFLAGPHTPIAKSTDFSINKWTLFKIMKEKTKNMNRIQRAWFLGVYKRFLELIGQHIVKYQPRDNCNLVDYSITKRRIPNEVKFDFGKTLFYFFVGAGRIPERKELPEELGNMLFG